MVTATLERGRITACLPAQVQETLEIAAGMVGATMNQFIVQAALREAERIIEQERVIRLSTRDAAAFIEALDNPAPTANTAKITSRTLMHEQTAWHINAHDCFFAAILVGYQNLADHAIQGWFDQVVADFPQPGFDDIQLVTGNANDGFGFVIHAEQKAAGVGIGDGGEFVGHAVTVGIGNPVAAELNGFQFKDRVFAKRYPL